MRQLVIILCVCAACTVFLVCSNGDPVSQDYQQQTTPPVTGIVINEFMVSNRQSGADTLILDEDSAAADWVEIYNAGSKAFVLKGIGLSDRASQVKYRCLIDTAIPAGGFFLFWGGTGIVNPGNHMGFKLSSKASNQEVIYLFDSNNVAIDSMAYYKYPKALVTNKSFGRSPDGSETWKQQTGPTPGTVNKE